MATQVTDPKTGKQKVVCGVKRADGTVCMNPPMRGRTRCKFHGGANLRGPSHPWFIHGKYSKELRRDILQNYYESLESGAQLQQNHEIALLDARISMLLKQASSGRDVTEMLVGLMEVREKLMELITNKDQDTDKMKVEAHRLVGEMDEIMEEFKNERRKWEEIYQVIDHRRKLIESERKAIIDSQRMMTEQQALVLMATLVNIIKQHVVDQDVRNAISADITRLTTLSSSERVTKQSEFVGPSDI